MAHTYTLPNTWLEQLDSEEPTGNVKTWLDARPFLGQLRSIGCPSFTQMHDALDFAPGYQCCWDYTFDSKDPA